MNNYINNNNLKLSNQKLNFERFNCDNNILKNANFFII